MTESRARAVCKDRHAQFAVPRTGYEAQLLRQKMKAARVSEAWLGYVKRSGAWTALDKGQG